MLKKVYLIFLSFIIAISLAMPSFAEVSPEAPEGATQINIPWTARYLYRMRSNTQWYSSDHTPTVEDFYMDNGIGNDQIAVVPGVVFKTFTDSYILESLMTYHMEYLVSTTEEAIDFFSYNTNINSFRFFDFFNEADIIGDISSSLVSSNGPYNGSWLARDIGITDTAIGITAVDSTTYKVQFTFSTPISFDEQYSVVGILFPSTGYLSEPGRFELTNFVAYRDPRGSYFDQLLLQATILNTQLLNGILESSVLSNEQLATISQFIDDQNSILQGDLNNYQDDSGFDSAAGALEDLESQINDQITGNVTIDGQEYEINGNLIGNYQESFMDRWDPQDYEALAGREISRLFELFYPYVGVAIFLNLSLAVILSFLRGRSNA